MELLLVSLASLFAGFVDAIVGGVDTGFDVVEGFGRDGGVGAG
jgi:hypothetical protein